MNEFYASINFVELNEHIHVHEYTQFIRHCYITLFLYYFHIYLENIYRQNFAINAKKKINQNRILLRLIVHEKGFYIKKISFFSFLLSKFLFPPKNSIKDRTWTEIIDFVPSFSSRLRVLTFIFMSFYSS